MKIAVIGSGGLVGTAILRCWNSQTAQDRSGSPFEPDDLIPFDLPDFDIASRICTDSLISSRPDVILNLASINLPDWLETHPNTARTIHVQGAANLRYVAQKTGALLVQVGCAEVFSAEPGTPPHTENENPNPESVYAKTKLDAERAAAEYERHLIIRTSALYGNPGSQGSGNLIETLFKAVRRTRTIQVLNDMAISPVYADDFVAAIRFLVRSGTTGLYHIAPPDRTTPAEMASFLLNACGLKQHKIVGISTDEYGYRAPRSRNTSLDSAHYHSIPGAYPIPRWQEGLRRFLDIRAKQSAPPLAKLIK